MLKLSKYMSMYRNDALEINDESVVGSIKDLMEYFRYEIANQSMSGTECDIEDYIDNVKNIVEVLENLQEDLMNEQYTENDVLKVSVHPMGGLVIEEV